MSMIDYWTEAVSEALGEVGIELPPDKLAVVANAIMGSHECIGIAFHVPEHPAVSEADKLRRELRETREAMGAREYKWAMAVGRAFKALDDEPAELTDDGRILVMRPR